MMTLPPNEDLTPYVGKTIKIEKKGTEYTGVLLGRGTVITVKTAHSEPEALWTLQNGKDEIHFTAPDDGWVIHVL